MRAKQRAAVTGDEPRLCYRMKSYLLRGRTYSGRCRAGSRGSEALSLLQNELSIICESLSGLSERT